MLMKEYIPAPHLHKYIHRYWIVSSLEAMPAEKCVLDGFVKLFIYLNDNLPEYYDTEGRRKDWGDGIGGHQTDGDLLIKTPENLRLIFCIFKPYGFYRLFNIPIHHLNNNVVPLEVFLGRRTRELKERILSAPCDEAKIGVVDDFFSSLARPLPTSYRSMIEYAQDQMLQRNGLVGIDDLSRQSSISRRSLERHFSDNVGMPPKYYARVLRFNYAFGLKRANPALDWFDIIYDCGYFDQTHFIKDFRHFTGEPPVAFYSKPHPIEAVYVGRASKNLK
ncbi:MAG TPA: helix-turn-helix domain-containing protein [Puia sp.]|jgi:AraC-like DNA-binding protein